MTFFISAAPPLLGTWAIYHSRLRWLRLACPCSLVHGHARSGGKAGSITWLDPGRQMVVVVVRWIDADHADGFFRAVGEAVDASD